MNKEANGNRMLVLLLILLIALLAGLLIFKGDQFVNNADALLNNAFVSLSKNKILSAVPQSLRNNVYLIQKESGCCKTLTGDVAVAVVLVSDSAGQWDEESVANLKEMLDAAKGDIVAEATSYQVDVSLEFHYYNANLTGDLRYGKFDDWVNPALKSAGLPSLVSLHQHLTKTHSAKEAPVVFAFNKPDRAYARQGANEYLVLYSGCDEKSFRHELSHIFGAMDFYFPKSVKTYATNRFPDSVMLSGETADPLTAYLIGWTDTVADNALEFLKETNDVTEAYLRKEHKAEVFTGEGTKEFENGTYTGELYRGVCNGTGTMQYNNGGWYTGQWTNGTWTGSGAGKIVYEDGDVYEGAFLNGKRHGQGTYTWTSGSIYTGNWAEGAISGSGTMQYANGGWYTGQWENGKVTGTGQGKRIYENGVYEGEFLDDKRHGQGTYTWTSGSMYTGQWVEGERSGYGTYTRADGTVMTGMFENGKFKG